MLSKINKNSLCKEEEVKLHTVLESLRHLKKDTVLPPNLAGIKREECEISSSEEEERSEPAETTTAGGQEVLR